MGPTERAARRRHRTALHLDAGRGARCRCRWRCAGGDGRAGAVHGGARQHRMQHRPAAMRSGRRSSAESPWAGPATHARGRAAYRAELDETPVRTNPGRDQDRPRKAERKPRRRAGPCPSTRAAAQARGGSADAAAERRPGRSSSAASSRRPLVGPAAELAGGVSGLPRIAAGCAARRPRVGGHPEDGVEAGARVRARGGARSGARRKGGASGCWAAAIAASRFCSASARRRGRGRARGRPIRRRGPVPRSVRGSSGGGGGSGSWRWAPVQ